MSTLVNALFNQLDEETIAHLFLETEPIEYEILGNKLNFMSQKLKLLPYTKSGQYKSKHIQPISHDQIKPILLLCPSTFMCTTATCNPRSLIQCTRDRDIAHTKLIIGTTVYDKVQENVHYVTHVTLLIVNVFLIQMIMPSGSDFTPTMLDI